jgi:hypothetical protein
LDHRGGTFLRLKSTFGFVFQPEGVAIRVLWNFNRKSASSLINRLNSLFHFRAPRKIAGRAEFVRF